MIKLTKGIGAAGGIGIGPAYRVGGEEFTIPKKGISKEEIPQQISMFTESLVETRREITEIQKKISAEIGQKEADIFNSHLLILEDRMLVEEIVSRLNKERLNVAFIFWQVIKRYTEMMSKMEDDYLKERVVDIKDVSKRVLSHLLKSSPQKLCETKERVIIVAHTLSPSDMASMRKKNVIAFVTDIGGKTSHVAIMAKALEIPAVVGVEEASSTIQTGDSLIVDGSDGVVIVNPDMSTLHAYQQENKRLINIEEQFNASRNFPAVTTDGHKVEVKANIEFLDEIGPESLHGVDGIGLYRTEYLYMNRKDMPGEEEHFEVYKQMAKAIYPNPVTIRTVDLGGDKFSSIDNLQPPEEGVMGWRSIRYCFDQPDIFKVQLRAVLRASVIGNIRLMYPMISGIEELRRANMMLQEAKQELRDKHADFNDNMKAGIMIEVPSAAMTADILAKETDFFSIGTNDLIQFTLAIDRTNERIADLYHPAHPAVLRLIKNVIQAAHDADIKVGMCGEMAGDQNFTFLLLGLGLDEFSMPVHKIPEIKYIIRSVSFKESQEIADEALTLSSYKEVEKFMQSKFYSIIKKIKLPAAQAQSESRVNNG